MKLKSGLVQSQMGEEFIVVATGEAGKNFNGMIRNNATAAFLVEHMQQDTNLDQLVADLLEVYDVDEATARKDVSAVIEKFREAGLLVE